jgi:hypothetical protein
VAYGQEMSIRIKLLVELGRDGHKHDICGLAMGDDHHFNFDCSALAALRIR